MCGISGIVNRDDTRVSLRDIEALNHLIAHRGPDDEGYYFGKNFAFGHRRLAILDLSEAGHQPMSYRDNYTVTYNGEIYNYLDLKRELEDEGYTFLTKTDTEVLLAAYDKWGEFCVERFNGMWAFALYDRKRNILFCSRDRFGIKPFYYTLVNNKFVFGSEIKQLLSFYGERVVNERVLIDYLVGGLEDHLNETFFKGIYKLEQAHNLIYDLKTHTFALKRYYTPTLHSSARTLSEAESIERYRELFQEAVALRLRSDVKVGTCLSGGLDSSSVTAVASGLYREGAEKRLCAMHAKSVEPSVDESSFAQRVASHCHVDLTIIEPSTEDFIEALETVVYVQEEPFGSPSVFMQYFVMQKAREAGCKVMLDGQGGDETLLGYERYYPAYLNSLGPLERIRALWNITRHSSLSFGRFVMLYFYFTRASLRIARLKKKFRFVKEEYLRKFESDFLDRLKHNASSIERLQMDEIEHLQLPHLLRYEDKNAMFHSVETRLPFVDFRALEWALSIRSSLKMKRGWSKYVLRKSIEDLLPREIVWRRNKIGFEAPEKTWLKVIEEEMATAIKSSEIIRQISHDIPPMDRLDNRQKWRLFNIAKWEKVYRVKIESSQHCLQSVSA